MPVALFASGALSVLAYGHFTRNNSVAVAPSTHAAQSGTVTTTRVQTERLDTDRPAPRESEETPAKTEEAATAVSADTVATWIAQATGTDAAKRAAAITALAEAPKADAVPVLAQVLETADDADRPLALRSLRTLAQRQGDADDRIRSVVREMVFHDGDEAATQAAQATLDDIERDLSETAARKQR
jgi:hypothetical protein